MKQVAGLLAALLAVALSGVVGFQRGQVTKEAQIYKTVKTEVAVIRKQKRAEFEQQGDLEHLFEQIEVGGSTHKLKPLPEPVVETLSQQRKNMAIQYFAPNLILQLSTDTKPATAPNDSLLIETDTQKRWIRVGGAWVQESYRMLSGFWGDGSDGNVTISGTVTLTRDMFYDTLTVPNTAILKTANYRVFCKTLCQIDSGGIISNDGNAAAVNVGAAVIIGTIQGGSAGANGGTTTGSVGGVPAQSIGGTGGGGGLGSSGAGGAATTVPTLLISTPPRALPFSVANLFIGASALSGSAQLNQYVGGHGGSSGGGDGTAGGGGGLGGGIVIIAARRIINNGTIRAKGGAGGVPAAGNRGGGGGGGGGILLLNSTEYTATTGTTDVTGGAGGAKTGTGVAGSSGGAGTVYNNVWN